MHLGPGRTSSGARSTTPPDDPVLRALERYAGAALDADPGTLARGRDALVARFLQAPGSRAIVDPRADRRASAPRRWVAPTPSRLRTRVAAGLAAALLVVAGAGATVAASGPGGPLYTTRVALEALSLPPAGSSAWYSAEAVRLGDRLAEAEHASASDNVTAVEAAVQAYQSILSQTVSGTTASASASIPPGLARALDRHEAILERLLDRAPSRARPALEAALGQLQATVGTGSPALSTGPGRAPGSSGSSATTPGHAVAPGASAGPGTSTAPGRGRAPAPAGATPPAKGRGDKGSAPGATAEPAAVTRGSERAAQARARTWRHPGLRLELAALAPVTPGTVPGT